MPTAIIDLDYHELPPVIGGLERYRRAQALVRVHGCPAAWVRVPVEDGTVRREAILAALRREADALFWQSVAAIPSPKAQASAAQPQPARARATVAVCTRDRADDLRRCLDGLQRMQGAATEVLVIDSASRTDATRQVVAEFPSVRYVRLDRPGLNVARNAAMQRAAGEIVVFIDDDAIPDPRWLAEHLAAFRQPLTMASMGLTLPLELESEAQEQFEAFSPFSRGFTPRTFDLRNTLPPTAGKAGAGVNMALRRCVYELVGPFDEALDAGTPTQSGGESELLARLIAYGYRVVYTPSALNWHRHRREIAELRRTVHGYGVGVYAFWTSRVLKYKDWKAPVVAGVWFWHDQLPRLVSSFVRFPGAPPWPLPWDELRGCLAGPRAYVRSRRAQKAMR